MQRQEVDGPRDGAERAHGHRRRRGVGGREEERGEEEEDSASSRRHACDKKKRSLVDFDSMVKYLEGELLF